MRPSGASSSARSSWSASAASRRCASPSTPRPALARVSAPRVAQLRRWAVGAFASPQWPLPERAPCSAHTLPPERDLLGQASPTRSKVRAIAVPSHAAPERRLSDTRHSHARRRTALCVFGARSQVVMRDADVTFWILEECASRLHCRISRRAAELGPREEGGGTRPVQVAGFSVSHAACYETKLAGRDATDRQNKGASTPRGPHMCHHSVWRQSWRTTRVARLAPMLTCRPLAAFPPSWTRAVPLAALPPSWTRAVPLAGTTRRLSRSPRRSAAAAAAEQGRCRRRRRRARPLASRQL